MTTQSSITLEQTGSAIGRPSEQRDTLKGLGLNKIGRRSVVADTPSMRGMIAKVRHLIRIVDGQ